MFLFFIRTFPSRSLDSVRAPAPTREKGGKGNFRDNALAPTVGNALAFDPALPRKRRGGKRGNPSPREKGKVRGKGVGTRGKQV